MTASVATPEFYACFWRRFSAPAAPAGPAMGLRACESPTSSSGMWHSQARNGGGACTAHVRPAQLLRTAFGASFSPSCCSQSYWRDSHHDVVVLMVMCLQANRAPQAANGLPLSHVAPVQQRTLAGASERRAAARLEFRNAHELSKPHLLSELGHGVRTEGRLFCSLLCSTLCLQRMRTRSAKPFMQPHSLPLCSHHELHLLKHRKPPVLGCERLAAVLGCQDTMHVRQSAVGSCC